jgi:hypothetical protein
MDCTICKYATLLGSSVVVMEAFVVVAVAAGQASSKVRHPPSATAVVVAVADPFPRRQLGLEGIIGLLLETALVAVEVVVVVAPILFGRVVVLVWRTSSVLLLLLPVA